MQTKLRPKLRLSWIPRIGVAALIAGLVAAPIAVGAPVKNSTYSGKIKSYKPANIKFYVSNANKVTNFSIQSLHKSSSCMNPGGTTAKRLTNPSVSIKNNKFFAVVNYQFTNGSKAKYTVTLHGTFNTGQTATGTAAFKYADSACSGSGSWTAITNNGY